MKKYLMVSVLVGLVIWGMYVIQGSESEKSKAKATANVLTDSNQGKKITVGLEKENLAPDFELRNVDGKTFKLSELRGKKVIVNFWTTWCPPCRQEMPDMEELYSKYKSKNVEILAVNLIESEKSRKDVPEFIKTFNITFPVLYDEKANAGRLYNVSSIPASFIIDTQGVIREKLVGPMTYEWMEKTLNAIK
jgi:peroxiredoxin